MSERHGTPAAEDHFTAAATPDREVALVIHYDRTKARFLTVTPDQARDIAAQITAAADRAERPPRIRTMTVGQPDRSGLEWAHEDDERL